MEPGNQGPSDVAPHGAIVQIVWEIHEKKRDGSYYGAAKDQGRQLFVLNGIDRTLTAEYVNALLDVIKERVNNVNKLEINEERLRESYVSGVSGPQQNDANVFCMRGSVSGNPASRPGNADNV